MRARVVPGRGDLARWMARWSDTYERTAGAPLVPGSLDLLVDEVRVMDSPDVRSEAEQVAWAWATSGAGSTRWSA